ncbi:MAG: hypothetical protein QNK37_29225 [Acidobacteriota bacterium]|nr:hypothetical protein [Acidobacteriota bacterium]
MLMMCLWLGIHLEEWRNAYLGYYAPLQTPKIIVTKDHHIYAANLVEDIIQRFGPSGKPLPNIGRKGSGPGEFVVLRDIFLSGNRLYAVNRRPLRIESFSREGRHLASFRFAPTFRRVIRLKNGWAGIRVLGQEGFLVMMEEEPDEERVLLRFDWPKPLKKRFTNGRFIAGYNPAAATAYVGADSEGEHFFFAAPNEKKVSVISTSSGLITRTIQVRGQRMAFDKDWGNARFNEMLIEIRADKQNSFVLESVFPKYFPRIFKVETGPDGMIWILNNRHFIDPSAKPMVVDFKGVLRQTSLPGRALDHVIAIKDHVAYIRAFDQQREEFYIQRKPVDEIGSFLESTLESTPSFD